MKSKFKVKCKEARVRRSSSIVLIQPVTETISSYVC